MIFFYKFVFLILKDVKNKYNIFTKLKLYNIYNYITFKII